MQESIRERIRKEYVKYKLLGKDIPESSFLYNYFPEDCNYMFILGKLTIVDTVSNELATLSIDSYLSLSDEEGWHLDNKDCKRIAYHVEPNGNIDMIIKVDYRTYNVYFDNELLYVATVNSGIGFIYTLVFDLELARSKKKCDKLLAITSYAFLNFKCVIKNKESKIPSLLLYATDLKDDEVMKVEYSGDDSSRLIVRVFNDKTKEERIDIRGMFEV